MSNITKNTSAGVAGTICLPTAVLESSVEPYLELSDFLVYYAIQCSINNANKGLEPKKQLKNVINVEQIATRLNYPIAKVYDAMLRLRNGCYIDFTGFTAKKAVLTLKRDPKDDALMIDGLYYNMYVYAVRGSYPSTIMLFDWLVNYPELTDVDWVIYGIIYGIIDELDEESKFMFGNQCTITAEDIAGLLCLRVEDAYASIFKLESVGLIKADWEESLVDDRHKICVSQMDFDESIKSVDQDMMLTKAIQGLHDFYLGYHHLRYDVFEKTEVSKVLKSMGETVQYEKLDPKLQQELTNHIQSITTFYSSVCKDILNNDGIPWLAYTKKMGDTLEEQAQLYLQYLANYGQISYKECSCAWTDAGRIIRDIAEIESLLTLPEDMKSELLKAEEIARSVLDFPYYCHEKRYVKDRIP